MLYQLVLNIFGIVSFIFVQNDYVMTPRKNI